MLFNFLQIYKQITQLLIHETSSSSLFGTKKPKQKKKQNCWQKNSVTSLSSPTKKSDCYRFRYQPREKAVKALPLSNSNFKLSSSSLSLNPKAFETLIGDRTRWMKSMMSSF
ncbi:unnamed protein product [Trifolium pratense]|uniref:Uncharacterized protein n=1 Tax=Trifolium pratense TaxID=57577 RepID=A0ACB0L259_TRIPR|nr:unnamed protein product [Trifolium pratense]